MGDDSGEGVRWVLFVIFVLSTVVLPEGEDPHHYRVLLILLGHNDVFLATFQHRQFVLESHAAAHLFLELGIAAEFSIFEQLLWVSDHVDIPVGETVIEVLAFGLALVRLELFSDCKFRGTDL